jgi:manganese-dependent inorganic pyrophosphatase
MFESTADVSRLDPEEIVGRDMKEYETRSGKKILIAQVETVGAALLDRREELLEAMERLRQQHEYALFAVMLTDIMSKGTHLLVTGDVRAAERAFGQPADDGMIELPGVMSRKKQVAPRLLEAF